MAWFRCLGNGGGSGGADKVLGSAITPDCFDASASFDATYNETTLYYENLSGTDSEVTIFTYTATEDCTLYFPNWSRAKTDTGSNEGYIKIEKNSVELHKEYLLSSMQENQLNLPESIDLKSTDTITILVGFDNSHSQCDFYIQTYPIIISTNPVKVLEGGQVSSGSPGEYMTATFDDISGLEYVIVELYDTYSGTDYFDRTAIKVSDIPASGYLTHTFQLDPNSSTITATITRTSISVTSYSGNWKDIYANVFVNVGSGSSSVSQTVLISETDFDNLATKDPNTLYEVYHNDFGTQILKRYVGSKRVTRKGDISSYLFWYEDVACIQKPDNKSGNTSEIVVPGISWNDFISRDWVLEFNVTSLLNSSESALMGSNDSGMFELYFGSTNNLYIYGFGPDRAMTDCNGADIRITYTANNRECKVYRNDTLIDTFTASGSTSSSAYIQLFDYRDNYKFLGIVKYIGFKWLS